VTNYLFVVQRYGPEVPGGAEAFARLTAEHLVDAGHHVTVVTSCAVDYQTWADHYPAGESELGGVRIVRLPVVRPRDLDRFGQLSARTLGTTPSAVTQEAWMLEQGPNLDGLAATLRREAADHDVAVAVTYLYPTTLGAIDTLAGVLPIIIHPTAHDELPLRLPLIRKVFDLADGIGYLTPEEQALVQRRFRPTAHESVIGIGFDQPTVTFDPSSFRSAYDIGDDPYLLYLGRIDPNKGAQEALDFHRGLRGQHRHPPKLVMAGADAMGIEPRRGVVLTGFLPDEQRWNALAGALALWQPSRQESFSMVLPEAWLAGRPGIVQAGCDVLAGFAQRSGGAIPYRDYAEFEAATTLLSDDPQLATRLAASGLDHVKTELTWGAVLERYAELTSAVLSSRAGSGR
jgi:glycosyltransferase involved in cell wall biosynthesis